MQAFQNTQSLETAFTQILNSLSEKEKNVLEKRIGIQGERKTLQSIWNSFNPSITRERVRQIEDSGIKKLGRIIKTHELSILQETAQKIIALHGWVLTRDKIINALIKELQLSNDINAHILEVVIQADVEILKSKPKLGTQTYFMMPNISKSSIEAVYKESLKILKRKKDVMEQRDLYLEIQTSLQDTYGSLSTVFIDSCLDIFDDIVKWEETLIGLTRWKILNPKTLKDKAIYVMKKEAIPMHFIEISNKITEYLWDHVKINTIHNELIRNDEFVLIWRGIYALKEWGFKPGNVLDVIVDILKKNMTPLSTEEITKRVLKVRNVKKTTIYMNLQNKKVIKRVGRNFYDVV